jgi:Protein of unknown function (DUF1579)
MQTHSAFRHASAIVVLCGWVSAPSPVLAQSPAPGPEHQQLKVFVGEWDLNAESKAVPALGMNDSGKVVYHHVNEMTNGGFFLETRRTGMSARGPVSELFVYGYSPGVVVRRHEHEPRRQRNEGTVHAHLRSRSAVRDGTVGAFEGWCNVVRAAYGHVYESARRNRSGQMTVSFGPRTKRSGMPLNRP